jgi:hypothetical protein
MDSSHTIGRVDQEFAERQTLELACEDWCGIWEPLWILNTQWPDLPAETRARLAAGALRRLSDLGYITFIRVPWPRPSGLEQYANLPIEEVAAELEGPGWKKVPPASDVWFVATPEGQAAYHASDSAPFG